MQRRYLGFASLLVLAACSSERMVSPDSNQPGGPAFAISSGNPKFAWRPPIANQTATGALNPNLAPKVTICPISPTPGTCTEITNVPVVNGAYQTNWKSSKNPTGDFKVRVLIRAPGESNPNTQAGFADVTTKNPPKSGFFFVQPGTNLVIKFVLTYDCSEAECVIDPSVGGTITANIDGNTTGVSIPSQPGGGSPIHLNLKKCIPGLESNGLVVYGSCITVDSDLEGTLSNPAVVFICDALQDPDLPPDSESREHIELHRRHNGLINVLDNAQSPVCGTVGSDATVGSVLRALAHGEFKKAGRQLLGLIGPTPLYALHLGAGGSTGAFSDFQFAEAVDPLPIGYESTGWSYQIDGTVSEGWQAGPLFGLSGQGGFGDDHFGCPLIQTGTHTAWPSPQAVGVNSNLYLRRDVFVSEPGTISVAVAIDNDIQVWVDGNQITPGLTTHEGCPTLNSFTFSASGLSAGVHKIAIRALDRGSEGGSSYFDASITFVAGGGGD